MFSECEEDKSVGVSRGNLVKIAKSFFRDLEEGDVLEIVQGNRRVLSFRKTKLVPDFEELLKNE